MVDGGGFTAENFPLAGLLAKGDNDHLAAYLNILIFDEDFNVVDGGYEGVMPEARENGTNVPHQRLSTAGV